jgi:hypothetical protein
VGTTNRNEVLSRVRHIFYFSSPCGQHKGNVKKFAIIFVGESMNCTTTNTKQTQTRTKTKETNGTLAYKMGK